MLFRSGSSRCWGLNNNGQLGIGTSAFEELTPTTVAGSHKFKSIFVDHQRGCGLKEDGSAYCWGANLYGQLGDGTSGFDASKDSPTAVQGGHKFKSLGIGDFYNCGHKTDGLVYCWGQNDYGQIGDNTSGSPANDRLSPTAVDMSGM